MSTQNKLKIGITAIAVLLIAFYTYCLFEYGGEYLSGIKSNAEMLVISLWPILCYAIAKYIRMGEKIGLKPFVVDCVAYNAVITGLIWILEEVIFKYSYVSADVTAEFYMYVISVIAFLLYNLKAREIKPDKWDVICFAVIIGTVISFWVCNQERIIAITESLNYSKTAVDADGDFINWISHRISMLNASFSGDFSVVNIHRIQPMIRGCRLAWLSGVGGRYIPAVIVGLNAVMLWLMVVYTRKNESVMISVVTISFIIKLVIGLSANLFLVYSTSVGVPIVRNIYDVLPLIIILLYSKGKNFEKR